MASKSSRFDFWFASEVVKQPLFKCFPGGLVTVKTSGASEVQLRIASNISTLYRKDIRRAVAAQSAKRDRSLVYSAISQTDLETGEITGKPRSRKFTPQAKKQMREAGGCMQDVYARDIWFLTLTLPGQTVEGIEAFALYDKEIKNAYLQNFRKLFAKVCPGRGESLDYLCVSELQDGGAIHLHIAIGWTNTRFKKLVKRCYRRWWHKILLQYSKKSGVDLFKSPDGYSVRDKPGEMMIECE